MKGFNYKIQRVLFEVFRGLTSLIYHSSKRNSVLQNRTISTIVKHDVVFLICGPHFYLEGNNICFRHRYTACAIYLLSLRVVFNSILILPEKMPKIKQIVSTD